MWKWSFVVQIALLSLVLGITVDEVLRRKNKAYYCKLPCGKDTHVMCKFKCFLGRKCKKSRMTFLTVTQEEQITIAHNLLRESFARGRFHNPPAANMRFVSWDEELARIAHRIVLQCDYDEGMCFYTEKYLNVSHNYGSRHISLPPYVHVLDWFSEWQLLHNISDIRGQYQPVPRVRRFTNVVWANVMAIGCAVLRQSDRGITQNTLLCVYGPAGNRDGEEMYQVSPDGAPHCPEGTKPDITYNHLCRGLDQEHEVLLRREFCAGAPKPSSVFVFVTILLISCCTMYCSV